MSNIKWNLALGGPYVWQVCAPSKMAVVTNRNVFSWLLLLYFKSDVFINLNCSFMTVNSSTYVPGLSLQLFVQSIYTGSEN